MLENGTLRDLVPLMDNPSTYLAQRAIHTLAAFATHSECAFNISHPLFSQVKTYVEDGMAQIIEQNAIPILVAALERDSLVGHALDAITKLAENGRIT